MKHILLLWLFSCSLAGFSQDIDSIRQIQRFAWKKEGDTVYAGCTTGIAWYCDSSVVKDTLRCTLFVYFPGGNSILHTKDGFVVRQNGRENIFLDDRKRRLKGLEVLTFKIK